MKTATCSRSSPVWSWAATTSTTAPASATPPRWRPCLTALGSGATSNSYTDYEAAGCLLVTGCDPTTNHPVAAARMRRAVVERGAGLIVINPRRIDMCDYADLWLRPYPGTDVALLNAMAHVIVAEGLSDADFVTNRTEGYNDWLAIIDRYSPGTGRRHHRRCRR